MLKKLNLPIEKPLISNQDTREDTAEVEDTEEAIEEEDTTEVQDMEDPTEEDMEDPTEEDITLPKKPSKSKTL